MVYIGHMMDNGYGIGIINYVLGSLIMLGIIVLVGLGIIAVYRYLRNQGKPINNTPNAMDVLNERYARGEINSEEYKQIKTEILKSKI